MKTPRGAVLVEDYRLRQHPWKAQQLKRVNIYLRTTLQDRGSTQPPRQASQPKWNKNPFKNNFIIRLRAPF
ncbi:hypothetical protein CD127_00895 [Staphylococcus petrasii]|nr:hypothetical protein CD127_00895 [Staphylococcus petrasii]